MKKSGEFVLSTQCACFDEEGNAWIFLNEMNALFYRNMESGATQYVTSFDREDFSVRALYSEAVWFQNKIFLIPCAARDIAVYDTVQRLTEYISLNTPPDNYNVVSLSKNRLLLYSVRGKKIAHIISLEELHCEHITIDYGNEEAILTGKFLRGTACCCGTAYFVIDHTNKCVAFDVGKRTVQICSMEKKTALFHVASAGQYLYMMHADGCAYDVYKERSYVKTIKLINTCRSPKEDNEFEKMEYVLNTVVEDGRIVSVPMRKQPVMVMQSGKLTKFLLKADKISDYVNDMQPLYVCRCFQNKLVFFPYHGDAFVIINLMTAEVQYQSAKIDIMQYEELFQDIKKRKRKFLLETQVPVEKFLEYLQHDNMDAEIEYGNVGTEIYRSILQEKCEGRFL